VSYPRVLSERDTLAAVREGLGLARYGDGEIKLARGRDAKSQHGDPVLAKALARILIAPPNNCLVCIPNVASPTPKAAFWTPYGEKQVARLYDPHRVYGSSFITRPDSAPWIDTPDYWAAMIDTWRGLDVVLVRGSSKSLTAADLGAAKSVREMVVSRQHAWDDYGELLATLMGESRRVILCLGATATVLAWELAAYGVQALDLGHVGMFLRKEGRFDRESFPP
jgi:hypothetical protein